MSSRGYQTYLCLMIDVMNDIMKGIHIRRLGVMYELARLPDVDIQAEAATVLANCTSSHADAQVCDVN